MVYEVAAASIMGLNDFGVLINLHIQDFFDTNTAIMYYNYVAMFFIITWATISSAAHEHRYMFSVPFLAAVFIFIGWLRAYNPTQYWGSIVALMLIGGFMYMDSANKEKRGTGGAGQKVLTIAFTIMAFSAAFGFVSSSNIIPLTTTYGTSSNTMCGTAYQCDAAGNPNLDSSVTQLSTVGGMTSDLSSMTTFGTSIVYFIWTVIAVIGAVVMLSAVVVAAFPVFASSPQALMILGLMQLVIYAVYFIAIFNWYYKPGYNQGEL